MSRSIAYLLLVLMLFESAVLAQSKPPIKKVLPEPIAPLAGSLVLENEFVRVVRPDAGAGVDEIRGRTATDIVIIPLSEIQLTDGEKPAETYGKGIASFVAAKSPFTVRLNKDGAPPLLVQLKKDWGTQLKRCAEPMTCVRPIKMSNEEIGQTRLLFNNGYLTGTLYTLVKGASLTSTYYSARGTDHLLFVPLVDAQVNFSGTPEQFRAGQAYFSSANEVEVSGPALTPVSWVVLRIHIPGE